MPWADEQVKDNVNTSEITKDDAERIDAVTEAYERWRIDVVKFRDQLVKEGSASLLVEFDKVEKKLDERLDHINTGRDNSTSDQDSAEITLGSIVVIAIIGIPWFIGVISFFR